MGAQLVCEVELYTAFLLVQEMPYNKHVVKFMRLKVKLSMTLKMDNKSGIDHANSWSVSRHMHHVGTKQVFPQELKEERIIVLQWIPGIANNVDIFKKNLKDPLFNKFVRVSHIGDDKYLGQVLE